MKTLKFLPLLLLFVLASCSSVRVYQDYDKNADFSQYKTYAYHKSGIDKAEISDLDKKRILRSIDEVMATKGFTKSENPEVLINFTTKEREQVDVNQFNAGWGFGWGWGWGWNPWLWGNTTSVNRYTEGILTIDIIDAKKKELIWQGEGEGALTKRTEKKDEKIKEFVSKILEQYPPKK
ncbi:DUF4136 domain-containing protein [Flavobacterium dankookense]|uniref:Uncharacterized protein DUF4136 n=1 Tax=Flavobacterium dankookense TaxID=706186 RepID=A0A4R6Q773_9FLAO|nr:DUF4136 domain-containing protein [Flavobacterium dankookense]TDP58358.1 uncharacterized protein DUF4136 [Flavobacterium dankookense]